MTKEVWESDFSMAGVAGISLPNLESVRDAGEGEREILIETMIRVVGL